MGVATLATGTIISQFIPLIISPIISRLYDPIDYALLAAYGSITLILTIISTGMYDSALMLDKEDEKAINTGAVAVAITLTVTIISVFLILIFQQKIINFIGNVNLRFWLFLVPFTVFFQGIYQTLNVWNNRKGRYQLLASNKIVMTTITSTLTLCFGYFDFHETGLVLSLILGQFISFMILFFQTIRKDKAIIEVISKSGMKLSLIEHKDFPKYNMPQGFLDALKDSGLVWIISFFYGSVALGSYSFAKNILMRPLQVIGSSVGQVYYQRASKIYNEGGNLWNISMKTFRNLTFIGFPFAIIVFIFGEDIFQFVFGNDWGQAGSFSEILIFWLLVAFIASPFGSIPIILKRQKFFFLLSIFYSVLPILVMFIFGFFQKDINYSICGFSIANICLMILILLWIRYLLIKQNFTQIKYNLK